VTALKNPQELTSPNHTLNQKVIFIGGAGHSGSTLLGLVLGSNTDAFYAGEARKSIFIDNPKTPLRKRICKTCGASCAIWSHFSNQSGEDPYAKLSAITQKSTIIDSTKNVEWIEENNNLVRQRHCQTYLILLSRDGRAVTASRKRKYPERPFEEQCREWVAQLERIEHLATNFNGTVLKVSYEQLAQSPETTTKDLCASLNLTFEAGMLDPWNSEQHPLGGNAGTQSLLHKSETQEHGSLPITGEKRKYYQSHPRDFVLDLRWKNELTPEDLNCFSSIAGEKNKNYYWEGAE